MESPVSNVFLSSVFYFRWEHELQQVSRGSVCIVFFPPVLDGSAAVVILSSQEQMTSRPYWIHVDQDSHELLEINMPVLSTNYYCYSNSASNIIFRLGFLYLNEYCCSTRLYVIQIRERSTRNHFEQVEVCDFFLLQLHCFFTSDYPEM